MIALPLFIPMAIFLTVINQQSTTQFAASNFARQLVRAYVTSPNESFVAQRMGTVESIFSRTIFPSGHIQMPARYQVQCGTDPCLTPKSEVRITVFLTSESTGKVVSATASEFVDAWGR